jgi:hypothetical protein
MRVSVVATGIDAAAVQQKIRAFEETNLAKMPERDGNDVSQYDRAQTAQYGGAASATQSSMTAPFDVVPGGSGAAQHSSMHGQNAAGGGYGGNGYGGANAAPGNQPGAAFGGPNNGEALNSIEEIGQKKKSPSLFERLTGMRRPFSSGSQSSAQQQKNMNEFTVQQKQPLQQQQLQQQQRQATPQQQMSPEEDLEIPAFLRRG